MKANELRRGNKVTDEYYESFGTIITVESINDKGINLEIADDGNWPECATRWIEPEYKFGALFGIPLTPEMLQKCGFEATTKGFYTHPNWVNLSLKYRNGTYDLRCNFMERVATNIDYLHHLQNIYHSHTGEELIYTP